MFATSVPQAAELRLTEGEINEIHSLSETCVPLSTIAIFLKLPLAVLVQLYQTDERVKEAICVGRAKAEKNIAAVLFRNALSGNVAAAIWLEKTRFGRCEPPRMINNVDEVKELSVG